MAKLTNREARNAIEWQKPFITGTGSLRGTHYLGGTGIMRNPAEVEQLTQADKDGTLDYVVYSYSTPIAWVISDEWVRTTERYSVTTSKHTGLCPLSGTEA